MIWSRTCRNCFRKRLKKLYTGKRNPHFGKGMSLKLIRRLKRNPVKHHKYLKENSNDIMIISRKTHSKLHNHIYEYVYLKYGTRGIDNYLKWFNKNRRRIF